MTNNLDPLKRFKEAYTQGRNVWHGNKNISKELVDTPKWEGGPEDYSLLPPEPIIDADLDEYEDSITEPKKLWLWAWKDKTMTEFTPDDGFHATEQEFIASFPTTMEGVEVRRTNTFIKE